MVASSGVLSGRNVETMEVEEGPQSRVGKLISSRRRTTTTTTTTTTAKGFNLTHHYRETMLEQISSQ
jgi:hypothetical protein